MSVVTGLDLAAFATEHARLSAAYLAEQERLGCTRPDWRFAWVAADGGVRARVVYWAIPGQDAPCLIDVVTGDDGAAIEALLMTSLARLGVGAIDYQATRPTGAGRCPEIEPPALERAGFVLTATQQRLRFDGPAPAIVPVADIELRTIEERDEEALLVPLMTAVRVATGDRVLATRHDVAGELAQLRGCAHDRGWWTIALDRGQPIGFILPLRTDGGPVIGDIGVLPAARRRGVGRLLLAHATSAVVGSAGQVVADVDDDNASMLAAAAKVGYRAYAARAHYVRDPGSLVAR